MYHHHQQQFDMPSVGFSQQGQQQFTQNFQPIIEQPEPQEQPGVSEIKKFLKRLCESYTHGNLAQPKPNSKKAGSFNKAEPKRDTIPKRIEQENVKNMGVQQKWFFRLYHFPMLNVTGTVSVLSEYLSTRLIKSKQQYDIDCAQIALACIFQMMTQDRTEYLGSENINHQEKVSVLRYFLQFSGKQVVERNQQLPGLQKKTEDELDKEIEQHQKRVIQDFYDHFIVGIFDHAVEFVKNQCIGIVNQNGGIGTYSFNQQLREQIRVYIHAHMYEEILLKLSEMIGPNLRSLVVQLERKEYLDSSLFEEKIKDTSNTILIIELPVLMQKLNIIKNVSLGLPTWTRNEMDNGSVIYGDLPLNQDRSHKLSYCFGTNWKTVTQNGERETLPGTDGKRKAKILSSSEICDKITKTFSKHFDSNKGKTPNIHSLGTHEKYIDISEAVISTGTGLQISNTNDNVVLPFVGRSVSFTGIHSSKQFESLPADQRLAMILSCIGYIEGSAKINPSRVATIVTELHRVFGVQETAYTLNTVKRRAGYAGSIFGAQQPQQTYTHYSTATTL